MEAAKEEDDAPPVGSGEGSAAAAAAAAAAVAGVDDDDAPIRQHVTFADPLVRQMSVQSTRPDYFRNLRKGSITNLRLEGRDDDMNDDVNRQERRDSRQSETVVDMDVAVAELRRRLSARWTGNDGGKIPESNVRFTNKERGIGADSGCKIDLQITLET